MISHVLRQKTYSYSVTCVIMGGGAGSRLHPLTWKRAKPAVPLAAKFRLIDIPISNCLNSGLNRIFILTQFNSTSLHRHISSSYHFDRFSRGFVEILAAQQTPNYNVEHAWYEGTADAVRKNLVRFRESGCDEVLILSGDQIYRMDYTEILATHRGTDGEGPCDVTIAGLLVNRERARTLGVMRVDAEGKVLEFVEKPGKNDALFQGLEAPPEVLADFGITDPPEKLYVANMGIYAFNMDGLEKALSNTAPDFGKEVLPALLERRRARAHLFDGYWEDIGTIAAFHRTNIALASANAPFNFFDPDAPIYTAARLLPATKFQNAAIKESFVSDGCVIEDAVIESSLIGVRSIIGKGCTVRNTYMMGADVYESRNHIAGREQTEAPALGIGSGSHIENAIIDKNARVGRGVSIRNRQEQTTFEDGKVVIREGIVIVPRGAIIPDGYSI